MGEILDAGATDPAPPDEATLRTRRLCRLAESFHTTGYYTPEIAGLTDDGFRGWWHAYFAYRFAPLGAATPELVTATAYNFAPRMVERAVPSGWTVLSPEAVIERHRELVGDALARIFGTEDGTPVLDELRGLLRRALESVPGAGRALYAGHASLPWPTDAWPWAGALLDVWHACTLIREFRFDGHNAILLADDVDGVQCHVLMAAFGHGRAEVIERIRGWTPAEWGAAVEGLVDRGWIDSASAAEPAFTEVGRRHRAGIERRTDARAGALLAALTVEDAERTIELLSGLVDVLLERGEVAGVWPPPTVLEPG